MAISPESLGIDRAPATVAQAEIEIFASRHLVWNVHTYINAWSRWQPEIAFAVIEQPPAPGVRFRWYPYGRAVTSTIDSIDEAIRIRWFSVAGETCGIQDWTFTDTARGVRVATRACLSGPSAAAKAVGSRDLVHRSHTLWLRSLKKIVESR
jgi:hypothetical protein